MVFSPKWQWIEWLCHTNFSFLIGASHPGDYVERAIHLGYQGIGICDFDGVYGIPRSYLYRKKIAQERSLDSPLLNLFYGCEFHLDKDHHLPVMMRNTLVLFALNGKGYHDLCQFSTYSHRAGKKGAHLPLEYLLRSSNENLICLQPMRGLCCHRILFFARHVKNLFLMCFKGFADYGFPESHAISFALISYTSSYIKCHFPVVFYTSLLNSQPLGFYSVHVLLQSAKREGVLIKPICVGSSQWESTLEPLGEEEKIKYGYYGIRLGLHLVRGIQRRAALQLIAVREKKSWQGLEDFLTRSQLHRGDLTSLGAAKALHLFGLDRRSALWIAEAAPYAPFLDAVDPLPRFAPEDPLMAIQQDFRGTSTTLGSHPTTIIKKYYWYYSYPREKVIWEGSNSLALLWQGGRKKNECWSRYQAF